METPVLDGRARSRRRCFIVLRREIVLCSYSRSREKTAFSPLTILWSGVSCAQTVDAIILLYTHNSVYILCV